jgi:diacylglycerol kinase (ATP)
MRFSIKQRLKSFSYAFAGIRYFISTQHNAWIQLVIAGMVIIAGISLKVTPIEWCLLLFCIGLVLALEAVNTAIEKMADTLHPGKNEGIGKAKDASAGAVLVMATVAAIIGLIIFVPRILALI